jgi:hypothetical protein
MKSLLLAALFLASCKSPQNADIVPYISDVCVVTDNKLHSMGDPITKIYGDREIKFCCRPCVKEFEADQAKFMAILDAPKKK